MIYTKGQVVKVVSASCGDSKTFLGRIGKIAKVSIDTPEPYLVKFYTREETSLCSFRHKEVIGVEGLNDDIDRLAFFNMVKIWEG